MYVRVISDDSELKVFCYECLRYGGIYEAEFINNYYTAEQSALHY